MPDLTPEEKQRIYLEEKTRLEALEKTKAKEKLAQSKIVKGGCAVFIVAIAIIIIFSILKPSGSQTPTREIIKLNAIASRSLTNVEIKNNDTFDWTNIKIELNAGMLNSGYYYKAAILKAGNTATIGLLNFAKSNGERLNPYAIKVQKVYIFADTPNGAASYAAGWD